MTDLFGEYKYVKALTDVSGLSKQIFELELPTFQLDGCHRVLATRYK